MTDAVTMETWKGRPLCLWHYGQNVNAPFPKCPSDSEITILEYSHLNKVVGMHSTHYQCQIFEYGLSHDKILLAVCHRLGHLGTWIWTLLSSSFHKVNSIFGTSYLAAPSWVSGPSSSKPIKRGQASSCKVWVHSQQSHWSSGLWHQTPGYEALSFTSCLTRAKNQLL